MGILVEFSMPVKPYSINAAYYLQRSRKRVECRQWEKEIAELASKSLGMHELKNFKEFHVEFIYTYPEHIFYNAAGHISAKTMDLSNTSKLLLDVLFNMVAKIDDRYVTVLNESKRSGINYDIKIIIKAI